MTVEKSSEMPSVSIGRKIYDNIPSIGAIIMCFLCMSDFFVKGGVPASGTAGMWLGFTWPFCTIIATIWLVLMHVRRISNRESGWWRSIICLGALVGMCIAGFALTIDNAWVGFIISIFGQAGAAGIFIMCSISIVMGYLRVYVCRTRLRTLMVIVGLFTVANSGGILAALAPWLVDPALWLQAYWIGQIEFTVWMVYDIGTMALIVRILLLQEKVRP